MTVIWQTAAVRALAFWHWLIKVDTQQEIVSKFVAAAMLALSIWAIRLVLKVLRGLLRERRRRNSILRQVTDYRDRLEQATFCVHHSWMKEDQTLGDILVPMTVSAKDGTIQSLDDVILKLFTAVGACSDPPRLVLTGPPGSGKSVALRAVARQSWQTILGDRLPQYLPVLISFADFRKSEFELFEAIAKSLADRGFEQEDLPRFVGWSLRNKRLVILLDGLDELKEEDRKAAVGRLIFLAEQNSNLPIVLTCRATPFMDHRAVLSTTYPIVVEMAEFIPAAIRRFVSRWRFDPPKSSAEFLSVLADKPHLRELAKNPLMLTILTFLYSLPKYRLPDNRAQFYEVCARALLEEWDQSRITERANRFARQHKEDILARLAFEHLRSPDPDLDIEERTALHFAADEMRHLGLNPAENVPVLKEVQHNSGLLLPLPPGGLRFPHQTFLEYFAGLYILARSSTERLLELYAAEPHRWREPLLLYCGLTTRSEDTRQILQAILKLGDIELALEMLASARAVPADLSAEVMNRAGEKLKISPTPALVEQMGCLSANRRSAFADTARGHLADRLSTDTTMFSDDVRHALVLALVRRSDQEAIQTLVENFDRLQMQSILPKLQENALRQFLSPICAASLSPEGQQQLVESLRLAEMPAALYDLIVRSTDTKLVHAAAIAL